MNAATVLAIIAIAAILYLAARYIYKEKKKGKACIGCPYADSCPRNKGTACGIMDPEVKKIAAEKAENGRDHDTERKTGLSA